MKEKPVVMYFPHPQDSIVVGNRATIHNGCVNHPNTKLNDGGTVWTSPVVKKWEGGFETQNSFYRASHH